MDLAKRMGHLSGPGGFLLAFGQSGGPVGEEAQRKAIRWVSGLSIEQDKVKHPGARG
jgi:hypothetical protein